VPVADGPLTILTQSVPSHFGRLLRRLKKPTRQWLGMPPPPRYGGHFAVTRSLVEGLTRLGVDYNYNPTSITAVHDTVVVLSGLDALRQAIHLRRTGRISRLLAGPNLVVLPTDEDGLVTSPHIDIYLLNSPWTQQVYEQVSPSLRGRTRIFPSGVDTDWWWDEARAHQPRRMLFYNKRPPAALYRRCQQLAGRYGFEVNTINYGHYRREDYRQQLHRTGVLVHWAEQESQGISLLEAWAADVPTLVWNPGSYLWQGKNFDSHSSPYLSDATGATFHDAASFERLLVDGFADRERYRARKWAVNNLSDTLSAGILLTLVQEVSARTPRASIDTFINRSHSSSP
jgi:hypothetical protein